MLMMLMASPAVAATETHNTYLGVATLGRGLVYVDRPPYSAGAPSPEDYTEWESPIGSFRFLGKAMTVHGYDGYTGEKPPYYSYPTDWYMIVPATLKAYGSLRVTWSYQGLDYEVTGRNYSRSTTYGLLEPDHDILWIKGAEGQMDFVGTYKAGSQKGSLTGGLTFLVVPSAPYSPGWSILVRLQIGASWPTTVVSFYWYEESNIDVPSALLFMHEVVIV